MTSGRAAPVTGNRPDLGGTAAADGEKSAFPPGMAGGVPRAGRGSNCPDGHGELGHRGTSLFIYRPPTGPSLLEGIPVLLECVVRTANMPQGKLTVPQLQSEPHPWAPLPGPLTGLGMGM